MSSFAREIISRATLGVIATAILYAALVCGRTAIQWHANQEEGSQYPFAVAVVLGGIGIIFAAAALLPTRILSRMLGSHPTNDDSLVLNII